MSGKNYSHQLDAKNRMRIPAKLREELGDNYSITVGTGGCLYVYTAEQMKHVKETLTNINSYRDKQLKAARYILYNTWDAEEDNQGRILLPENLRKYAKIEKNIKVFKGPNCVEIWSEEVWNDYFNDVNFEELADALDELTNNG
jgi:MraZ protein